RQSFGHRSDPHLARRFRYAPEPAWHPPAPPRRAGRGPCCAQGCARRNRTLENASNGTDHGTASAHLIAGGRVKGGLYGEPPRLTDLDGGNLRHAVDFRSLYATALEGWWNVSSLGVLSGRFPKLELL